MERPPTTGGHGMKRHLVDAEYLAGLANPPIPQSEPNRFAVSDDAERQRLSSSPWFAAAVLSPRDGAPSLLPSSLDEASKLLACRNALVCSAPHERVEVVFRVWDGSAQSSHFAFEAATAISQLLSMRAPSEEDIELREVHLTSDKVANVLGRLGIGPMPRPELSLVPPLPQS